MKTALRSNEKVILTARKHWLVLTAPTLWAITFLIIALIAYRTEYDKYLIILSGVAILWLIYQIISRKNDIWVVTDRRVIDEYGVFSINSEESPLDKINTVSYQQPFIGRIFNFGHVQIQSAAEMGSITERMVETPKLLKDTITRCQDEYRTAQIREQAQQLASTISGGQSTRKTDISEELTKLHDLKVKGIITEEEFNQRKSIILNS